jgi:hypothetical protein
MHWKTNDMHLLQIEFTFEFLGGGEARLLKLLRIELRLRIHVAVGGNWGINFAEIIFPNIRVVPVVVKHQPSTFRGLDHGHGYWLPGVKTIPGRDLHRLRAQEKAVAPLSILHSL